MPQSDPFWLQSVHHWTVRCLAPGQNLSRRNYNTLGRLWSDANIPAGPLAGSKINISTTLGGKHQPTTTYKTTFPTPMQAWTKYSRVGTTPTPHKTTTIPVQAQKKPHIRKKPSMGYVVIPYTKGIAQHFKIICDKYGIQAYFKSNTTIKQISMKPKDQDPRTRRVGHIQLPVWGYCLWWGVQKGNIKDPWWKIQGVPKTTLSHPCTHPTSWTYYNKQQLQHHWGGRTRGWPGP